MTASKNKHTEDDPIVLPSAACGISVGQMGAFFTLPHHQELHDSVTKTLAGKVAAVYVRKSGLCFK